MAYKPVREGTYWHPSYGRLMTHKGYSTRIAWSPTMLGLMRDHYPTTTNEEMAGMLGVSARTVVRKAREMGLEKDRAWLKEMWDSSRRMAHAVSKGGNSGSFRKGEHANRATEFKPGHKLTSEQAERRRAALKKWHLRHPGARSEWAKRSWETRRKASTRSVESE